MFFDDQRVQGLVASFYEAGKVTAVICHATCVMLKPSSRTGVCWWRARLGPALPTQRSGSWTSTSAARSSRWIEDEARQIASTNFIVNGRFKPHAVRDGNLITGQQQYSGATAARLMIEALGV
jgi:putative intracellular protease/amidase